MVWIRYNTIEKFIYNKLTSVNDIFKNVTMTIKINIVTNYIMRPALNMFDLFGLFFS